MPRYNPRKPSRSKTRPDKPRPTERGVHPLIHEGFVQALAGVLGIGTFLQLRRSLLQNPERALETEKPLAMGPVAFALQPTIILTLLAGVLLWWTSYFTRIPDSPYDVKIAQVQQQIVQTATAAERAPLETLQKEYERARKLQGFTERLTIPLTGLSLLLAAFLFGLLLTPFDESEYPALAQAEQVYLYLVTARSALWLLAMGALSQLNTVLTQLGDVGYTFLVPYRNALAVSGVLSVLWYGLILSSTAGPISRVLGFPARARPASPDDSTTLHGPRVIFARLLGAQLLSALIMALIRAGLIAWYSSVAPS